MVALNPTQGLLALVFHGDLLSRAVMLFLLVLSILSWGLILKKALQLSQAAADSARFRCALDRPMSLNGLILAVETHPTGPILALGFEAIELRNAQTPASALEQKSRPVATRLQHGQFLERLDRALEAKIMGEEQKLAQGLSWLATLSSAAPFVGLFGTVLGVIDALASLGQTGGDHLSAVGPGIAAALVATALGLLVAIPA